MKVQLKFPVLLLFAFLGRDPVSAQGCFYGWQYQMPITLTGTGTNLNDIQVPMLINTAALVSAGHMQVGGEDIRFGADDCCTSLCYWIEKGMNTANTLIWVRVPSVPAAGSTPIFMYYGNPAANDAQNGDCTFLFFDDFTGVTLNLSKWTVRGTPTVNTVNGGIFSFSGNSNWEYIKSNTTFSSRVNIHSRERSTGVSAGGLIGYGATDNRFTVIKGTGPLTGITHDSDLFGSNAWFNINYPGTVYPTIFSDIKISASIISNTINIFEFNNQTAGSSNLTQTGLNTYSGSTFFWGYSSYNSSYLIEVDRIFITQYTANPPNYSMGAELQTASRPLPGMSPYNSCDGDPAQFCAGNDWLSYTWNTGDTSICIDPNNIPGLYICCMTNVLGCEVCDTVDFIVNTLPDPSLSPQAAMICPEDSILLEATFGFDSYLWSTADSTYSILVNQPGLYWVEVLDINGCIGRDTAYVSNFPDPGLNIGGDSTFSCEPCALLDAGPGYTQYIWSNAESTQTVCAASDGLFFVEAIDSNGCYRHDTTYVTLFSPPTVSIGPDTSFCEGDSILTSATGTAGVTYTWSTNDTTQSVFVSSGGNYSVVVSDANGCEASDSVTITENPAPLTGFTFSFSANTYSFTDATTPFPASWSWNFGDGNTSALQNPTHTFGNNGTFNVCLTATDSIGCSSESCEALTFTAIDASWISGNISIYPVPANDQLFIEYNLENSSVEKIELISPGGFTIVSLEPAASEDKIRISLDSFSTGIYFVKVSGRDGMVVKSISIIR